MFMPQAGKSIKLPLIWIASNFRGGVEVRVAFNVWRFEFISVPTPTGMKARNANNVSSADLCPYYSFLTAGIPHRCLKHCDIYPATN